MRIIKFNGESIYINANVLTPFFYKQQFKKDFLNDINEYRISGNREHGFQIVWALSKSFEVELIDYDQWIELFNGYETDWEFVDKEIAKYYQPIDDVTVDKKNKIIEPSANYELTSIQVAYSLGFSLDFIKQLLPADIINLLNKNDSRKANQEDIDRLLA